MTKPGYNAVDPDMTARDSARGDGASALDYDEQRSYCPTCGNETEWVGCWAGCDDGWIDEYELDPTEALPGEMSRCEECGGEGGYLVCRFCHPGAFE